MSILGVQVSSIWDHLGTNLAAVSKRWLTRGDRGEMASLIFGQLQTPQKGSVSSLKQRSGSLLDHVKSPQLRSIAAGLLNDKQKKKRGGGGAERVRVGVAAPCKP